MKTDKRPAFKRGDRVVYYDLDHYGIRLSEATVTAVRQEDGHWIVHTLVTHAAGSEWRKRFTTAKNGHRPYPRGDDGLMGQLRLITGADNLGNLKKRAEAATGRYRQREAKVAEVQRQVEHEASSWKYEETRRRTEVIPDGLDFMYRVLSRMGFRRLRLT